MMLVGKRTVDVAGEPQHIWNPTLTQGDWDQSGFAAIALIEPLDSNSDYVSLGGLNVSASNDIGFRLTAGDVLIARNLCLKEFYVNSKSTGDGVTYSYTPGSGNDSVPSFELVRRSGLSLSVVDTQTLVHDPTDTTKLIRLDAGAITTGTTRVIQSPDRDIQVHEAWMQYRISGLYYDMGRGTTGADLVIAANTLYGIPCYFPRAVTINEIGIDVQVLEAAKSAYLGCYLLGTDGYPGALVWDAGTVSLASAGPVSITSLGQTSPVGWCYLALLSNATGTAQMETVHATYNNRNLGAASIGVAQGSYVTRAQAYGALPNPFGGTITVVQSATIPLIGTAE